MQIPKNVRAFDSRAVVVTVLCVISVTVARTALAEVDESQVRALIQSEMQRQRLPAVAYAVIDHGRVAIAEGVGWANVELRVPMSRSSVFHSGSMSQMFTAAAVLVLAEDGRLALSDRLASFFPDVPESFRDISIRQLLTHTSGISDYIAMLDLQRDYSDDELVKIAFSRSLQFAPGGRSSYTNTNYLLLGLIASKVAGRSFGDVLRERVFEPLGA